MKIFQTGDLRQESLHKLAETQDALWVYNGLDAAITIECFHKLKAKLSSPFLESYNFVRAMQGPALTLTLRGIKVDLTERDKLSKKLLEESFDLQVKLDTLAKAVWDKGLNPRSPLQLKSFFYDVMKLPEIRVNFKGESKLSTNREALEKLRLYIYARPFVDLILALRDIGKKLEVINAGLDEDNRMRMSYNVVGTETGRWSSSKNVYGRGTNGQNITEKLRQIFIPDDSFKMFYADLEQAEARVVAYLCGEANYIQACTSGDLHTAVARLIWPELKWTGDLRADKSIAEQPFYRHFSYRDIAKRVSHGSNYNGSAYTLSKVLHIPQEAMNEAQNKYFRAFPGIRLWHREIAKKLSLDHYIDTPLGRRRYFFGRSWDDATIREAIAFGPQSTVAEILNLGLYRLWKRHDSWIQSLAQVHDAVLGQYPLDREADAIPAIKECLTIPFTINGHSVTIPVEIAVGFNWAKKSNENSRGLSKYVQAPLPQLA